MRLRSCNFAALACALATASCGGLRDSGMTGITLTVVVLATDVPIDGFRMRAEVDGAAPLERHVDLGRAAGPTESVNLRFDDGLGGRAVTLIVESTYQGAPGL